MKDDPLPRSARTRLRRKRDRGRYDRSLINAVLDEALYCHVGLAADGYPSVVPTAYARIGEALYLHGAVANHALRCLAAGAEACVTVTLVDGLVLSRSAFHHSVNYRSVMIFGVAAEVLEEDEKRRALLGLVEHMVPGRSGDARPPSSDELRATLVVRLPIDEASAKIRTGDPVDDSADVDLPYWAGQIPLALTAGAPVPAADLPAHVATRVPPYAAGYRRPGSAT